MDDTAQLAQLIAALFLAVAFFLFCYFASPRKTVPFLICFSPFQLIYTNYATSSVVLTYVIGIAFVLRGRLQFVPMLGLFVVILFIYLVSTGFAHRATHVQHGLYIFSWVSAVLLFYVVYNFVRETRDIDLIVRTLIILDILVLIHSIIQVTIGPLSLFGLEEVRMEGPRRGEDARLSGPYGVGVTAEFLVINILFAAYVSLHTTSIVRRNLLYLLMAVNLGCLIATANRGGFLTLIGGAGLFLYMFRSQLGPKRTLTLSFTGVFLLVVMSMIVVNFTSYGLLYERLEATEIEGGVPDTRAETWSTVVPRIAEKPLLGHGPRLRLQDDYNIKYKGHEAIPYPHNLYLFLLYTVGFVGLFAYLLLFAWLIVRMKRGVKRQRNNEFTQGFIKLGLLFMVIFLIDEMKIDFLRFVLVDYWHYIFIVFAIWLALADMPIHPARQDSYGVPSNARDMSE